MTDIGLVANVPIRRDCSWNERGEADQCKSEATPLISIHDCAKIANSLKSTSKLSLLGVIVAFALAD